nr:PREDICTED: zinc finger CCHC domain-containing protein 14 isoform X2 [Latimeria chalumnae]|eukprot:XP_005989194.1 PREDICTED: zinc finger CCHC domain-containing protein 14 isoform X2 [Latimeria chalumnae]
MVEKRCLLQRDSVYRWFSELNSSQRVEFLCGLLDLCIPLELRFLCSCLEDLARKDYHSLRDSEIKANNPADLGSLTNITDEVVRSRLLVSLALLNSDNREAAGVLYRTLTHIDSIINNYGLQLNDGRTGDEFLLLFTMASNHPAFSFHQKQVLRQELTQIQSILDSTSNPTTNTSSSNTVTNTTTTTTTTASSVTSNTSTTGCQGCHKDPQRTETAVGSIRVNSLENALRTSAHSFEELSTKRAAGKHSKDPNSSSLHKAVTASGTTVRPIFGVASIQPSQNSALHPVLPSAVAASSLCSHTGNSGLSSLSRPQNEPSSTVPLPTSVPLNPTSPQTQEQNGILDWLRKLRLHKYYPVFKQLSMEKFLSLTEEDLNKFETLTMGAKKKLKTQLELEKEKSEKRSLNPTTPSSIISNTVARVPPTSHVGPLQTIRCNHAGELRVDVEQVVSHQLPRESSSSSEYSSSPSSPMGIQAREESSDSAEENDRRLESHLVGPEKEKPAMIPNHFSTNSVRPTAQVLPVQNDAGSNPPCHTFPLQMMPTVSSNVAPSHLLNSLRKSERGNGVSSLMHSTLSFEERNRASQGSCGSRGSTKGVGNIIMDGVPPSSSLQATPFFPGLPEKNIVPATVMNFGTRSKLGHTSAVDGVIKTAQQPALIETNIATTAPSNTVHHMSRSPMKILHPSVPADSPVTGLAYTRTAHYQGNTKTDFSTVGSMPVAAIPGTFCASSSTAPSNSHLAGSFTNIVNLPTCPAPSSSPTLSAVVDNPCYNSNSGGNASAVNISVPNPNQPQQQPGCIVCSSCGCSGNCGSNSVTISYPGYFQGPFSGPSMLACTLPFLPFSPLCSNGYMNSQQYNTNTAFSVAPPPAFNSSLTPDSILSGQSGFVMPPMQGFMGGAAGVYQAQAMIGNANGLGHKKSGNISCYNCGASGHRAQDCKQPSVDSNQQGAFRLKYAPHSESLDSAD